MAKADLTDKHLAELHAAAAELGVPGYRMLRRDALIEEIESRGGAADVETEEEVTPEPAEVEFAEAEPAEAEPAGGEPEEQRRDSATEQVSGVLDITYRGYGFLCLHGLQSTPGDVYISASQIRRCELRLGDLVSGPARQPERGERYPALVHVDLVNGATPGEQADRPDLDELTPVAPRRRLRLEPDEADVLTRAVDLLVPFALGQRVLVRTAPRSGRTTLLRGLAGAIQRSPDRPALVVLLVDERPEEAAAWAELLPDDELAVATAEMSPREQARVADLALERAKRRAEGGEDVVLVVDSLSRLAVAQREPGDVKHVFGAGRELAEEGSGSLTVIATVLDGVADEGTALAAVETTENVLVRLDPELAAAGVYPALDVAETRASGEEQLRKPDELEAVR
ncbi:MAG TPA: Rho termination factor N-terminal domain-containing protein, partial [Solirubrobacterales bacterium]|nr:Rho termination factor N-terminal domain-containing protein [Solirubrobacterales bacterium]